MSNGLLMLNPCGLELEIRPESLPDLTLWCNKFILCLASSNLCLMLSICWSCKDDRLGGCKLNSKDVCLVGGWSCLLLLIPPLEDVVVLRFWSTLGDRKLFEFNGTFSLLPVIIKVDEDAGFPASFIRICCTGIGIVFWSEGQEVEAADEDAVIVLIFGWL